MFQGPMRLVFVAAVAILIAVGVLAGAIARDATQSAALPSTHPPTSTAPPAAAAGQGSLPSVADVTERLARKLEAGGGTAEQWALLGRSYMELGRRDDAIAAYRRAVAMAPGDAALATELEKAASMPLGR